MLKRHGARLVLAILGLGLGALPITSQARNVDAGVVGTTAPAVERSPIPRDKKPDFGPLRYMLGTWSCSVNSSRRPHAFPAQAVTQISDDGYWIVTVTTTPPVSWNPVEVVARDYVTYDPTRKLWVDMTLDNYGLYGASISTQQTADRIVWKDEMYPKSHATAIHFPRIVQRVNDSTTVTTQRFGEPSGHSFVVTTTCRKQ